MKKGSSFSLLPLKLYDLVIIISDMITGGLKMNGVKYKNPVDKGVLFPIHPLQFPRNVNIWEH
jgi:hypothetical protein